MARAVPIDPAKLIEAARSFVSADGPGRPPSVMLRRAVSSAYYALFHCLTRRTAEGLLPNGTDVQQLRVARTLGHSDMKRACEWVAGRRGRVHQHLRPLVDPLTSTPISDVAASFCDLQEARHQADYDHLALFSKATVVAHINDADQAISRLINCSTEQREAFYSLLALCARAG